jgi:hypothetical protein
MASPRVQGEEEETVKAREARPPGWSEGGQPNRLTGAGGPPAPA